MQMKPFAIFLKAQYLFPNLSSDLQYNSLSINDIIGLINYMIITNALRETLSFFPPETKINEFYLSLSFSTLLFYIGADVTYTPESPATRVDQNTSMRGKLHQADHVFHFDQHEE